MRSSLVLAGFGVVQAALDPVSVDPSTGTYIDSHGRTRLFHGMNVVYKNPPWLPPTDSFNSQESLDPETMDDLQKWGFNVVRLGVMWPGVEPSLGEISQSYLQNVSTIASDLANYGVYTIADLHQDVGSRQFCGEGFPEHYIDAILADPTSQMSETKTFPWPWTFDLDPDAAGLPNLTTCQKHAFTDYYATGQVGALWKELYTPGTSLNEGFSKYWGAVAETFADAPHLLAYELLNEPSGLCLDSTVGSCAEAAGEEVVSDDVEKNLLSPLYRSAAKAIRAAGGKQVILYEPTVAPKIGPAVLFPGPVLEDDDQQGLAYHIYCLPDDTGVINDAACIAFLKEFESTYYGFLEKNKGVGGFMTEFGSIGDDKGSLSHISSLMDSADTQLQSWTYWMLKRFGDFTSTNDAEGLWNTTGDLETAKLSALSRTYAQATAGPISKMSFDTRTYAFELDFTVTVTSAPTEIYLNEELHYPHGYTVTIQPAGCFDISSPMTNYVHLTLVSAESACVHQAVEVKIAAKKRHVVI